MSDRSSIAPRVGGVLLAWLGLVVASKAQDGPAEGPGAELGTTLPRLSPEDLAPPPEDESNRRTGAIANGPDLDRAIALFLERTERNPRDSISPCYLGELLEEKGRQTDDPDLFAQAESALRTSLERWPGYVRAKASLASVLAAQHRFAEAERLAREAVRAAPENLDALALLGDALLERGHYDEAGSVYDDLARRADLPLILTRQAHLAEVLGRIDEAIALLRRALTDAERQESPAIVSWIRTRLADVSVVAGRLEEAEALYQAVIDSGQGDPHDAIAGLGRIRRVEGKIDEAIARYEQAVSIGPDPPMVRALADLYRLDHRDAEARALLDDLEQRLRRRPEHRRELAMLLLDEGGDPTEALAMARQDLEQRGDVYALDLLAWALHHNGRDEEAAQAIERALAVGTRDARLHEHAAAIYRALGQTDRAARHIEHARALSIDHKSAKADAPQAEVIP